MPLFLVTCLCDEGLGERSFRVVVAPSRLAVAEGIARDAYRWREYLDRSGLGDRRAEPQWAGEELLRRIDGTWVDGDSRYQMAIREITEIERMG